MKGKWEPYIKTPKKNVRIPKDIDPEKLTYEECVKLVEETVEKGKAKKGKK